MKGVLHVLGGVVAVLALAALSILSVMLAQWLFGPALGLGIWGVILMILGGGTFGWLVYRIRSNRRV